MSTNAINSTLDFAPESNGKGFLASVAAFFEALREGIEMANRYQVLTEQGVEPAVAAQRVMKSVKR